jgi:type VI secretion system protein ImpA
MGHAVLKSFKQTDMQVVMSTQAGEQEVVSVAPDRVADQTDHGVEYTAEFQELDALVNAFDSEGLGPLRKGERPFQWDAVASAAQVLLAQSPDLRVALWLLRALFAQRGLVGMAEGLARISALLALPEHSVFPRAHDGEPVREAHAITLAWLGSAALLHQLRSARLAPELALAGTDLHLNPALALALEPSLKAALLAAAQGGLQHLDSIIAALQQVGVDLAFNIAPLREELQFQGQVLNAQAAPSGADGVAQAPVQGLASGADLHTRAEVQQALNGLICYFQVHEPGHPAPLLLQRVQRMLGASFEELMGELYADAKNMIARIDKPQAL